MLPVPISKVEILYAVEAILALVAVVAGAIRITKLRPSWGYVIVAALLLLLGSVTRELTFRGLLKSSGPGLFDWGVHVFDFPVIQAVYSWGVPVFLIVALLATLSEDRGGRAGRKGRSDSPQ
ncbi:MAG: hypothetical protein ACUVXI_12785 [bacterium]